MPFTETLKTTDVQKYRRVVTLQQVSLHKVKNKLCYFFQQC